VRPLALLSLAAIFARAQSVGMTARTRVQNTAGSTKDAQRDQTASGRSKAISEGFHG